MLWQLRCHCNPDHDKFSSTVVAIFPNVCLWRRSLCSNLALTLKNCIEPPSYASTAYVVAIWSSFLFDSFVKIWDTCENFLGKWLTPRLAKNFPYAYANCRYEKKKWLYRLLTYNIHGKTGKFLPHVGKKILVGTSNGSRISVWDASENWAVIWDESIFLVFEVCNADLEILCS